MGHEDLRDVLRIEADSFAHPWSQHDFIEHLEDPKSVALVVEHAGLVVGYEVIGIGTPWMQLYSCVVRRTWRRRGLGSGMVTHVVRLATAHEPGGILVKVPERNIDAQLFFRQCGFRAIRVLPAYLFDNQDVYVMKYSVPEWAVPHFGLEFHDDELIPGWEPKHG
jgi:ribosomal-protein-alanine N-acetyltransferase